MATRQAKVIQDALLERGMPKTSEFTLAVDVSKPTERVLTGQIADLFDTIQSEKVSGCAIILVTWPAGNAQPISQHVSAHLELAVG